MSPTLTLICGEPKVLANGPWIEELSGRAFWDDRCSGFGWMLAQAQADWPSVLTRMPNHCRVVVFKSCYSK